MLGLAAIMIIGVAAVGPQVWRAVESTRKPAVAALAINAHYPRQRVTLRKFPAPYEAMLAIESDADHVTLRKFNLVHEFLNTHAETPMGRGLGLDVSDSFFLYNGSNVSGKIDIHHVPLRDEMTFFHGVTHKLYDGSILLHYIHGGWIDTLHSMGDFTRTGARGTLFTRALAVYAIHYLMAHGVHITVYTDHGNQSNVANFGAYGYEGIHFFNYQQGDNPHSPYYVADLLQKEGVRFVWGDIYRQRYSYPSMIYPMRLRDGSLMWGFWRFTGTLTILKHPDQPWIYEWHDLWNPYLLADELSPARLRELIHTHGYTIIAQHLEGNADRAPLSTGAIEALTRLAHLQDRGLILVARTSRLLEYNVVQAYLHYRTYYRRGVTFIDIERVVDPVDGSFAPTLADLHGITFNVANPRQAELLAEGRPIPAAMLAIGKHTLGVRWYRPDYTNYAVSSLAQLRAWRKRRA